MAKDRFDMHTMDSCMRRHSLRMRHLGLRMRPKKEPKDVEEKAGDKDDATRLGISSGRLVDARKAWPYASGIIEECDDELVEDEKQSPSAAEEGQVDEPGAYDSCGEAAAYDSCGEQMAYDSCGEAMEFASCGESRAYDSCGEESFSARCWASCASDTHENVDALLQDEQLDHQNADSGAIVGKSQSMPVEQECEDVSNITVTQLRALGGGRRKSHWLRRVGAM